MKKLQRSLYSEDLEIEILKITAKNIKNEWLRDIFSGSSENIILKIKELQTQKEWKQDFEYDLILAFWMAVEKENFKLANSLMSYDISLKCITAIAIGDFPEFKPQFNFNSNDDDNDKSLILNKTIKKDKDDKIFSNSIAVNTQKQTIMSEGGEITFQIQENNNRIYQTQKKIKSIGFEGGDDDEDEESSEEKDDMWGSDNTEGEQSEASAPDKNQKSDGEDEIEITENKNKPIFNLFQYSLDNRIMIKKLERNKIDGSVIELTQISTLEQVQKLKIAFRLRCPILMANIAQILLYYDEVDLACYLTAYYEIQCDETMIQNAIVYDYFQWLNYLWVFDKNYVSRQFKNPETGKDEYVQKKYNYYMLFRKVTYLYNEKVSCYTKNHNGDTIRREKQDIFRTICEWKVVSQNLDEKKISICQGKEEVNKVEENENEIKKDVESEKNQDDYENNDKEDNILQSLLIFQQDQLCIEYMGYYQQFLNVDLFLFSIKKNNEKFIESSLMIGAFTKDVFKLDKVVEQIIDSFEIGSKTYFLLNILNLTDISIWKTKQLLDLIEKFQHFVEERFENNRLSSCSNPIMIICLSCEILQKIASNKKSLSDQCLSLKQDLLDLGQTISMKIDDDEEYYAIVTDKDFQNRSILKIITECNFYNLMTEEDGKAENILNNFYVGEQASQCDGNIFGYSILVHILTQKTVKKTEDTMNSFYDMITLSYEPNLKQDYVFQHVYRKKGINNYFIKEFIFSLAITIITLLIYYDYIVTFKGFDYNIDPSTYGVIDQTVPFDKNNYIDNTTKNIDEVSLIVNSSIYQKSNITLSTIDQSKIVNSTIINSLIYNSSIYNSSIINSTIKNSFAYDNDAIKLSVINRTWGTLPVSYLDYYQDQEFIVYTQDQNQLQDLPSQDSQINQDQAIDSQQNLNITLESQKDLNQSQNSQNAFNSNNTQSQNQSSDNSTQNQDQSIDNSTESQNQTSDNSTETQGQPDPPVYGQPHDFSQSFPNWIEKWRYYQYGVTGVVLLSPLLRIYFNLMPKSSSVNSLSFDFFLIVDIVFAVATFIAFFVISGLDHTFLEDRARKFNLDIMISVLMGLVLWKTFQLFMIVSSLSKMLVSLAGLFMGTLAFTFVNVFYLLFVTQFFYTIYYDTNISKYPNLMTAGQQSYNTFMAAYATDGFTDKQSEYIFTVLQYLSFVLGNLVLLTIMVALMMSYFDKYQELSSFLYKCYFYKYLERYLTAFQDENYGEIVVHNAPFNLLVLLIIPFTPFPSIMKQVSDVLSKLIFWMENIFFLLIFIVFEICLTPLVYMMTYFNILFCTPGIFTTAGFIIWWSAFGLFYLLFMLIYDTYYLIVIFSYHDGCKLVQEKIQEARQKRIEEIQNKKGTVKKQVEKVETELKDQDYIRVYNDVRTLVIEHYLEQARLYRLQKQEQQEEKAEETKQVIDEAFDVLGQIQSDINLGDLDPIIFQCKLVSIHDQWRAQQSQKNAEKHKENDKHASQSNDANKVQQKTNQQPEQTNQQIDIITILRQTLIGQKMNNSVFKNEQQIIEAIIEKFGDPQGQATKKNEDDDKAQNNDYSTEEDQEVEEFLQKFLVGNESSFLDTIDIVLMLRALPSSINHIDKVRKAKLFNFPNLQNSLTAFINKESVGSFEYYDEKNKDRVQKIKNRLQIQSSELQNVIKLVEQIKASAENNQKTLQNFQEIWDNIEKNKNADDQKDSKINQISKKQKGGKKK